MRVKTEAKRESILAAAAEIFLEYGFEGASMAEIAARIGGSKGTLYGYFSSKEDLFVAVMHEQGRKQFGPAFVALAGDTTDLAKTLQTFGEKAVGFFCNPSSIKTRRALISECGRSDIGKRFYEQGPKIGMLRLAAFLQRQMDLGKLRQADPALAARQLMSLLECETVAPMMLGIEEGFSKARIKTIVGRAVTTFLAAYSALPASASQR